MGQLSTFFTPYNKIFTVGQIATVTAIETLVETGRYSLDSYGLVVVLDDDAGISYGKNQATENSGTLYSIVADYIRRTGSGWERLSQYKSRLYDGEVHSKKGALTDDAGFKALLMELGKTDPVMQRSQRAVFHNHYMRPALALADEYDIKTPLGLLMIYDICIQSGPANAKKHIESFNTEWVPPPAFDVDNDGYVDDREYNAEEEATLEKAWVKGLALHRKNWLETFKNARNPKHTKTVRATVYRVDAILDLISRDLFSLDVSTPLLFSMDIPSGLKRSFEYTEAIVREVEGLDL